MIRPVRARGLAWIDPAEVSGLSTRPRRGAPAGPRLAMDGRPGRGESRSRADRPGSPGLDPRPGPSRSRRTGTSPSRAPSSSARAPPRLESSRSGWTRPATRWLPGDSSATTAASCGSDRWRARPARDSSSPGRRRRAPCPEPLAALAEKTVSLPGEHPVVLAGGFVPLLYVPREFLKRGIILARDPGRDEVLGPDQRPGTTPPLVGRPDEGGPPRRGAGQPTRGRGARPGRPRLLLLGARRPPGAHHRTDVTVAHAGSRPRRPTSRRPWDGRDRTLNRLRLLVHLDQSESLSLELPERATLGARPPRRHRRHADPIGTPHHDAADLGRDGTRSSLIVVDYAMEAGPMGDGSVLRPDRPRLDLPCLSFTWEVSAPAGWQVLDPGAGPDRRRPGRPDRLALRPARALEAGLAASVPRPGDPGPAEPLRQLDGRLGSAGPHPPNCRSPSGSADGTRGPGRSSSIDSRWPPPGWGRNPPAFRAGWRPIVGIRPGAAPSAWTGGRAVLRRPADHDGVRATPVRAGGGRGSTRSPSPSPGAPIVTTVSSLWHRWRGEVGAEERPRPQTSPPERNRPVPGRIIRRFSAPGWPGSDAFVHLVECPPPHADGLDRRRPARDGVAVMASARASGRRLLLPVLVVAACILLDRILPARYGAVTAGGLVGSLAILIAELARRTRRSPAPAADGRPDRELA